MVVAVDSAGGVAHTPAMRALLALGFLIALSACSDDPHSYGITGPSSQGAASTSPADNDVTSTPGVPTSGSLYGPSNGAVTGASGFWGYN